MIYIKLRLLVIAAMALGALGTGNATATELYSGATTLGVGTELKSTLSGSAALTDTSGNPIVTCSASAMNARLDNAGSATTTVSGSIEAKNLSFTSCTSTITVTGGGSFEHHHIAGTHNLTLTGKALHVVVHVFGVECGYGTGSGAHLGTLTGKTDGTPSVQHLAPIVAKVTGGFLCPSTARLIATYLVTSPTNLRGAAS